jgi:WD40-like Beta Propeller Repeat
LADLRAGAAESGATMRRRVALLYGRGAAPPFSFLVRAAAAVVTMAVAFFACGTDDPTAPRTPGIHVLSGMSSDTIEAVLPNPLTIQVRGSDGQPLAGAVVLFFSPLVRLVPSFDYLPEVNTAPASVPTPSIPSSAQDTTDGNGLVSVRVRFGPRAPTGRLIMRVSSGAVPMFEDTITFTVHPGAPVAVRMMPEDTTVYVDRTVTLRGGVVDRRGNRRSEPVTYEAGPSLSVNANGLVTPSVYARSHVVVRGAFGHDTGYISVVPHGQALGAMHFEGGGPFVIFELDGSRLFTVPTLRGDFDAAPAWSPDGRRFVYSTYRSSGGTIGELFVADTTGQARRLLPSGTFRHAAYARHSRDGTWIYFSGQLPDLSWSVWRVHPDGSGMERIGTDMGGSTVNWRPDASPDGTRLVFTSLGSIDPPGNGWVIRTAELASHQTSPWLVGGLTARWSPTGERIAIMPDANGAVRVVNADGTNSRAVTTGGGFGGQLYMQAFDWSPDGQWLIMNHDYMITLLQVDTGLFLPLAWAGVIGQPSWRPQ